jgi:hypothetical protein
MHVSACDVSSHFFLYFFLAESCCTTFGTVLQNMQPLQMESAYIVQHNLQYSPARCESSTHTPPDAVHAMRCASAEHDMHSRQGNICFRRGAVRGQSSPPRTGPVCSLCGLSYSREPPCSTMEEISFSVACGFSQMDVLSAQIRRSSQRYLAEI